MSDGGDEGAHPDESCGDELPEQAESCDQADHGGRGHEGAVEGHRAAVVPSDPVHDGEVRDVREHRGSVLPLPADEASRVVQQGDAADGDVRVGLHRRCVLRAGVAPVRYLRVEDEQLGGEDLDAPGHEDPGMEGMLEWTRHSYPHDRYSHRSPVVDL